MKYMLMMNAPRGNGDWNPVRWAPEDLRAHMNHMHDLNRELKASGEFVLAEGLAPPSEALLVRAAADGTPDTDGPFAESKEFLAGFWIVEVESAARAHQIAARASAAPGPGGAPMGLSIEVRQVMQAPKIS